MEFKTEGNMKCWKRAFDGTSTYVHIQCTATAQQISKFKIYDNNINESFIEIAAKPFSLPQKRDGRWGNVSSSQFYAKFSIGQKE